MFTNTDLPATTGVIIDGNDTHRQYYAHRLRVYSSDYLIVEAKNAETGLDLYRSRAVDCVLLELDLPDRSGFQLLVDLVPIVRRPEVAVIVLTSLMQSGLHEQANKNGARACLVKSHTSEELLDQHIRKAIAFVGRTSKERLPSPFQMF
jgi:DNA-binding NarL/FixJ family response regulator